MFRSRLPTLSMALLVLFALTVAVRSSQAQAPAPPAPRATPAPIIFREEFHPVPSVNPPSDTVLPTDIVPLPGGQDNRLLGEMLQLRMLQKLPPRFYMNASAETSFRLETNPFQFPSRGVLQRRLVPPDISIFSLPVQVRERIFDALKKSDDRQQVYRVLPNITAGWAFTPHTRAYCNYFLLRDALMRSVVLNSVVQSIGGGVQHDFPVGRRGSLLLDLQFRELFQAHQQPVFDYLPGLTLTYLVTPKTVLFASSVLQLRGKKPFQAPTKEIDPFYTWGFLYRRGRWQFTNTATLVSDFRHPFRRNAIVPIDQYTWVLDFEVARNVVKKIPSLQAFVRAEPIYNFNTHNRPGLAGFDFRLYYGLRMLVSKQPLVREMQQIKQHLKQEQEVEPPPPRQTPPGTTPGAKQTLPSTTPGAESMTPGFAHEITSALHPDCFEAVKRDMSLSP